MSADHGHGLALSRVDLAGHDGRARLVLGQRQFTETAAGTRAKESDIVGDLHEGDGDGVQSTVGFDDGIVSSQSFKLLYVQ